MPRISRIVTFASAVASLMVGTAATASADTVAVTPAPQHPDPLSVPVQTITPLVTKVDDALGLRDSKDVASMAHLGSLENSKDLASLGDSLAGGDLGKLTSLEGSNWSHAGSSEAEGDQVNTTIPVAVPVNVPVDTVTNLPIQGINKVAQLKSSAAE
ncbi:hypothetical protein ACFQ68_44105 [Amycolatopsis japonica]|uniref:hypothetical protein n=1 Tax=Amycolatopsis japonica TaxID=208439 RepID=UPI00366EC3ED